MEKKTALYDKHVSAGGKIVPFAGFLLPVQYKNGIITEHNAVRERAGLFDVSHMGEFLLEGADALENLNNLLTNEFSNLATGRVRYSLLCNEHGGTVDDLLVYKSADRKYYIVVNASNTAKAFEWMQARLCGQAILKDISGEVAQVALQGPAATAILEKVADSLPRAYYSFLENVDVGGVSCLVSQTGYTGEDGYELYCSNADAVMLWEALMQAGEEEGMIPCGLGARDTLRLEAGMPLYGHELSEETTPREAGLDFAIKLDKPAFIGKDALKKLPARKRVGLRILGRGIAREGATVYDEGGGRIGVVTSGTMSPTLGAAIAMAYVPSGFNGKRAGIEVRGKMLEAEVVKLPFYVRENKAMSRKGERGS